MLMLVTTLLLPEKNCLRNELQMKTYVGPVRLMRCLMRCHLPYFATLQDNAINMSWVAPHQLLAKAQVRSVRLNQVLVEVDS